MQICIKLSKEENRTRKAGCYKLALVNGDVQKREKVLNKFLQLAACLIGNFA